MSRASLAARALLLGSAAFVVVACRTVPNVSPPPIPVPDELAPNDVELAIILAVAGGGRVPADLTPGEQIADEALGAILRRYEGIRRNWFFEDRDPGVVFVGFQHRAFYMRVAVHHTQNEVTLRIVDSRNLSQRWGRIHRRAMGWLQRLEALIRQSLGAVVQRNVFGDAPRADGRSAD